MIKCLEYEKELKGRRYLVEHVFKSHGIKIKEYEIKYNLIDKIECSGCNINFYPRNSYSKYCTIECQEIKYDQNRQDLLKKGVENEDYITCQWCNSIQQNLSLIHFNRCSPGKTLNDYKKEFPNHLTMAINYKKAILDNGGGVHMKLDKYRKMASDQIKGDKNPNHKSKTTLEQRQDRSPFSKEFYRKDNPNMSEELQQLTNEKAKEYIKDRINNTNIEYYLNQGYSQIEAKQKLSERQTTFSLEICIKKYGEEAGLKRWQERQKKWLDSTEGSNYSGVSQKLFWSLHDNITNKEDLYFKEFNKEIYLELESGDAFVVDFKYNNKIIEFNGDYWHANPNKYNENWVNTTTNRVAKDIWEKDAIRNNTISQEYDLLTICEYDYKNNPDEILQKCLEFLND